MRFTLGTLALASWLGISGVSEPLWTLLESLWSSSAVFASGEKEGATWDPDGLTVAPPPPPVDEGATWDPNG